MKLSLPMAVKALRAAVPMLPNTLDVLAKAVYQQWTANHNATKRWEDLQDWEKENFRMLVLAMEGRKRELGALRDSRKAA